MAQWPDYLVPVAHTFRKDVPLVVVRFSVLTSFSEKRGFEIQFARFCGDFSLAFCATDQSHFQSHDISTLWSIDKIWTQFL